MTRKMRSQIRIQYAKRSRVTLSGREDFVGVQEASEILGLSVNTVRVWGGKGEIPAYRRFNRIVFCVAELKRYKELNTCAIFGA